MLTRFRSTAPPRRITEESSRSFVEVEERRQADVVAAAAVAAAAPAAAAAAAPIPAFDGDGIRDAGVAVPPVVVSSSHDARGAGSPRATPSLESLRRDIADGLLACSPRKLDEGVAAAAAPPAAPASAPTPPTSTFSASLVAFLPAPPPFPLP